MVVSQRRHLPPHPGLVVVVTRGGVSVSWFTRKNPPPAQDTTDQTPTTDHTQDLSPEPEPTTTGSHLPNPSANVATAFKVLGDIAYRNGHLDRALTNWQCAANAGSPVAALHLGWLHSERGDEPNALVWWAKATGTSGDAVPAAAADMNVTLAEAGDENAMVHMGALLIQTGQLTTALSFLVPPATNQHAHAAWLISTALGPKQGFDWFKIAAHLGHPKALFVLDQLRQDTTPPGS